MKKRIFPLGLSALLYAVIALAVLAFAIVITVTQKDNQQAWRIIIVWAVFAIVLYFLVSPIIVYSIKLENDTLSMSKDYGLFEEDRVQSKESVNLKEIKEFKVILSEKNSKGEPYKARVPKRKFLSFTMNDEAGTIKRLFVHNLSNKQLLKLVDTIKEISGVELTTE
ncbi:MAG: hypothetical protein K6G38_02190 [Gammaproteobacteria bacterium]|nr:hypothetical protein [Gammaproteobacteria bacterium]